MKRNDLSEKIHNINFGYTIKLKDNNKKKAKKYYTILLYGKQL